jgi:hypothetical protein
VADRDSTYIPPEAASQSGSRTRLIMWIIETREAFRWFLQT